MRLRTQVGICGRHRRMGEMGAQLPLSSDTLGLGLVSYSQRCILSTPSCILSPSPLPNVTSFYPCMAVLPPLAPRQAIERSVLTLSPTF